MMSIGKLAPGQQQYYLDTVAHGAEEYDTGAKEAPGQWLGVGASYLGLEGEVDAETLHDVLRGCDPRTGAALTRAQGAPSVPGFDATFCAPKSVSLFFALGAPEVSNEVRSAHDAAVHRALGALESVAARGRRGKAGVEQVAADGFVAAAFRHRTSRAGDPQLHTHVVLANLVHAPQDDRWSALDARPMYSWAKTVGYLYESELTRRLGVAWSAPRHGIADIAGIPERVLRAFSRRRQQIEAHLERVGRTGARAAQVAAYSTREAKHAEAVPEAAVAEWHQRARAEGLDAPAITNALNRATTVPPPAPGSDSAEALFARLASSDGLTAQHAMFGRREVLQAVAQSLPAGADIEAITDLSDAFLASRHVIALAQARGLRSSDVIRRRDGIVVSTGADQARWTTPEMLAVEVRVVENATQRRRDRVAIVAPDHVRTALAARRSLSREQTRLVRSITRSGAGVDVVEGAAGTGKTYALAAAREAWEGSGHHVTGCALAARAAAELEQGSGIPSQTIHRLFRRLDDPRRAPLGPTDVLVVDEAAMVGTRTLARLLDHAAAGGAKVVLVGDHHQLPAIDAGGAFAGLARRLGATRLHDNRRQLAAWERRALARLRGGATDRALADYATHGRIRISPTTDGARTRMVDDWLRSRLDGREATMLAAHTRDVSELNRLAREQLQSAGRLGPNNIRIADRPFAVGDEIIATSNDYDLGVLNGTRGTITKIDDRAGLITASTDRGTIVDFPTEC
jgi:conjugative relaxase-like TrwC/TraI family protein